jgi:hypothetical protein
MARLTPIAVSLAIMRPDPNRSNPLDRCRVSTKPTLRRVRRVEVRSGFGHQLVGHPQETHGSIIDGHADLCGVHLGVPRELLLDVMLQLDVLQLNVTLVHLCIESLTTSARRARCTHWTGVALLFARSTCFSNPMLLFIVLFVWTRAHQECQRLSALLTRATC